MFEHLPKVNNFLGSEVYKHMDSGLAKLGYRLEICGEIAATQTEITLTTHNDAFWVKHLVRADQLHNFENLVKVIAAELSGKGIEIDLQIKSESRITPVFAIPYGIPDESKTLIGFVDEFGNFGYDLSWILPLEKRLSVLRHDWNEPSHRAAIACNSLAEEYLRTLDIDADAEKVRIDYDLKCLIKRVLKQGYDYIYSQFADQFEKQRQPEEMNTLHYSFGKSNYNVLAENSLLVSRLYTHLLEQCVSQLIDLKNGTLITADDWHTLDFESLRSALHHAGVAPNGSISGTGERFVDSGLGWQFDASGRLVAYITDEWKDYVSERKKMLYLHSVIRGIVSSLEPLRDSIMLYTGSAGFVYGTNGACPLAGESSYDAHAYDIFLDFGRDIILKVLNEVSNARKSIN